MRSWGESDSAPLDAADSCGCLPLPLPGTKKAAGMPEMPTQLKIASWVGGGSIQSLGQALTERNQVG